VELGCSPDLPVPAENSHLIASRLQFGFLLIALTLGIGCSWSNPVRSWRDRVLTEGPAAQSGVRSAYEESRPVPIRLDVEQVAEIYIDPSRNRDSAMSLADALLLAMKNSEVLRVVAGGGIGASPVTTYDPAIAEERVQAALASFDTTFSTGMLYTRVNQPPNAFFGPGLSEPTRRDEATVVSSLNKSLISGGDARISFNPSPGYLYVPSGVTPGSFNPIYVGNLEFAARQPLLRGAGVQVAGAPVRVAQFKSEQTAWDFKKSVMESLRSTCEAYWDLEAARIALKSLDEMLPLLQEVVHLQEENFKAKWVIQADVAKAYAQLYYYRQQRAQYESAVVEKELALRNLLRLPPSDGCNIIPATPPTRAQIEFDLRQTVMSTYANQPDLLRQQINVRIREVEFKLANNGLLPQVDLQALYRMNGLGQNLGQALSELSTAEFADWQVGATFSVPLGRRQAFATVHATELQLARERAMLQQTAHATMHRLGDCVRQIKYTYTQYSDAESRLRAADDWLKGARLRYQHPLAAGDGQNWLLQSLNDYLAAMRFRTDAATEAALLLSKYNGQLVRLEEVKGTLLSFFDIDLVDDPSGQVRVHPAFRQNSVNTIEELPQATPP
jgi:outer membrane protein TolC